MFSAEEARLSNVLPYGSRGVLCRATAQGATVAAVYRQTCAGAAAAASVQDWPECLRLSQIARSIAQAYPDHSRRARFSVVPHHES